MEAEDKCLYLRPFFKGRTLNPTLRKVTIDTKMAVTRLQRKDRKNRTRENNKNQVLKQITATPVIKNIDIEAIKAEFAAKKA